MRWLKLYEEFENSKVTVQNIIDCINNGGKIFATIIKDYPNNNPNDPLIPVSIDDKTVTVEIDGKHYDIDINNINRVIID
jgi:hypothetical protein